MASPDEEAAVQRQPFAINTYAIGGVAFLGVGLIVLTPLGVLIAEARWLILMGTGFAAIGLIWLVFAGRMGRLKDDPDLLQSGLPGTARILAVHATSATTRRGEHGPLISQVYRIDLGVQHPFGGLYQLRIYRSIRVGFEQHLVVGRDIPVRLDQNTPRKLAIAWHELAPPPPQQVPTTWL